MGRRRKLTKKLIKRLAKEIARGLPYDTAARLAGINPTTFYRWKREAEAAREAGVRRGILVEFLRSIEEAEAQAEQALVERVVVQGGARGAMWILERRWPEKWSPQMRMQIAEDLEIVLDWGVTDDADEQDATDSGEPAEDA